MMETQPYCKSPMNVLIKPVSGSCNLRCVYCFYADEMKNRSRMNLGTMNKETVRMVVRKCLENATENCHFGFQGGEPTLAGLGFYEFFVDCVNEWKPQNLQVTYSIQTNGTLLDDQWAEFLAKHRFLAGISLDGTEEVHDCCRKDANGNGTFKNVINGIEILRRHHVEFNILTVVHKESVQHAKQIYNFFKRNKFSYQQYIECLDPIGIPAGQQSYSLTPEGYASFLKAVFRKWYCDIRQGNYVYIRYFENLLLIMDGKYPESCNMLGCCGRQWIIEADGSVYPCDFYALDKWRLGNICTNSLKEMEDKRKRSGFIEMSFDQPDQCLQCRWYALCRNGCRRNCEPVTEKRRGVNYYCKSYQEFFEYAYPGLKEIYDYYRNGFMQ